MRAMWKRSRALLLMILLLAGCGGAPKADDANPIDVWYAQCEPVYGNRHSGGYLAYCYGEAYRAELENMLREYDAEEYLACVEREAAALGELVSGIERGADWGGTGAAVRLQTRTALVYRNAFMNIYDGYYRDRDYRFLFDAQAATERFLQAAE